MSKKKDERTDRKEKKKSSKTHLFLQDQLRRKQGGRELAKRFLIVCEDEASAFNYFNTFKQHNILTATSIRVVPGNRKTQPIQVVQRAVQLKEQSEDVNSGTIPFTEVWCVIDGDGAAAIPNARALAIKNDVKLAITTMCFEYWILLHYQESAEYANSCSDHISSLKKHVKDYSKGSYTFKSEVENVRIAADRAKRLRRNNELPEKQIPCSDLYLLIHAILGPDTKQTT